MKAVVTNLSRSVTPLALAVHVLGVLETGKIPRVADKLVSSPRPARMNMGIGLVRKSLHKKKKSYVYLAPSRLKNFRPAVGPGR